MKLFALISLFLLTPLLSAAVISSENQKSIEKIKNELTTLKMVRFGTADITELSKKLDRVSRLLGTAVENEVITEPEVLNGLVALYGRIVDRIVPEVLTKRKIAAVSAFALELCVLNHALVGRWTWNSSILVKASKLLYSKAEIKGDDGSVVEQYHNVQKSFIMKIDTSELHGLLEYFFSAHNMYNSMLPKLFYEKGSCGALTFQQKTSLLEKVLKEAENAFQIGQANSGIVPFDLGIAQAALVSIVMNDLDDSFMISVYKIFMITAGYILPQIDINLFLTLVREGMAKRKGLSVALVIDLLLEPNFAKRIRAKWTSLTAEQIKTWENAIIYIYVNNPGSVEGVIEALESPYKSLFLETADRLSGRIELLRKAIKIFDGQSYEDEINFLFDIYGQEKLCTLPLEIYHKVNDRIVDSRDAYVRYKNPLQLLAIVLSAFAYTKHFPLDKLTSPYFLFTILNYVKLDESAISESWKEKLELVLIEQMPKFAMVLATSSFRIRPVDLQRTANIFMKYTPDLYAKVIASAASASPYPETILDTVKNHFDLYQLALAECLLRGVRLDPTKINCNSSLLSFMTCPSIGS